MNIKEAKLVSAAAFTIAASIACSIENPNMGSAGVGTSGKSIWGAGGVWGYVEDAQGNGRSIELDQMHKDDGSECLLLIDNETNNGSAMKSVGLGEICLPDFSK